MIGKGYTSENRRLKCRPSSPRANRVLKKDGSLESGLNRLDTGCRPN